MEGAEPDHAISKHPGPDLRCPMMIERRKSRKILVFEVEFSVETAVEVSIRTPESYHRKNGFSSANISKSQSS